MTDGSYRRHAIRIAAVVPEAPARDIGPGHVQRGRSARRPDQRFERARREDQRVAVHAVGRGVDRDERTVFW